jgi:hypothetical protein
MADLSRAILRRLILCLVSKIYYDSNRLVDSRSSGRSLNISGAVLQGPLFRVCVFTSSLHLQILSQMESISSYDCSLSPPVLLPRVQSECKLSNYNLERFRPRTPTFGPSLEVAPLEFLDIGDIVLSADGSQSSISSASSISSISIQTDSSASSVSGSSSPETKPLAALSESVTPVNSDGDKSFLSSDQLVLRLHLHSATQGNTELPEWEGLGAALQTYYHESWHKDDFSIEECEKYKEFLFWNAVADDKWRQVEEQN